MKVIFDGTSKIVVSVADNNSPAQSLQTLTNNVWWTNAINGWFFCPNEAAYSRCTPNTTDLVRKSNGVLYSKRKEDVWSNKSVFGFDTLWVPLFVTDDGSYKQETDVENIFNGIWMPTLVKNWVNVAIYNDAMNNDPKQWKSGNKSFICSTKDKSTIYMWYVDWVTFSSVADYLIQTFSCDNAIELDNWWSKAMIKDNSYIVWPGRNIMDAFVVIEGDNIWPVIIPGSQSYTTKELQDAITRMKDSWLTKYSTISSFMPFNTMKREEAAKFFSVFATTAFAKEENPDTSCVFTDIGTADYTLKTNIISSCKLGLFKWSKWQFIPKDNLTNAQAVAVLIRIMVWMMDESTTDRYKQYIAKAKEFGLIWNILPNNNITRWEAAVLLYKAHLYKEKN